MIGSSMKILTGKKKHKYIAKVGTGDDVRYFYTYDQYMKYKNGQKVTVLDPNSKEARDKAHQKEAAQREKTFQDDTKKKVTDKNREKRHEKMKKKLIDTALQDRDPGKAYKIIENNTKKDIFTHDTDAPFVSKKRRNERRKEIRKHQLSGKLRTRRRAEKQIITTVAKYGKETLKQKTKKRSSLSDIVDALERTYDKGRKSKKKR